MRYQQSSLELEDFGVRRRHSSIDLFLPTNSFVGTTTKYYCSHFTLVDMDLLKRYVIGLLMVANIAVGVQFGILARWAATATSITGTITKQPAAEPFAPGIVVRPCVGFAAAPSVMCLVAFL